ncbi:MAG: STAS domain-containing protein [Opitutales bacterium]|nr:STAS domain-containing protein [Opitutales bacterium]
MSEEVKYFVRIDISKAYLEIVGRANYLNCKAVGEFFDMALRRGCGAFYINFARCKGMDSTFMGMIAGLALRLLKSGKPGAVSLCSIDGRNLELVENLGLESIVKLENSCDVFNAREVLNSQTATKPEILSAHKSLIEANPANAREFEDIVKFMQREIERSGQ